MLRLREAQAGRPQPSRPLSALANILTVAGLAQGYGLSLARVWLWTPISNTSCAAQKTSGDNSTAATTLGQSQDENPDCKRGKAL